jgi:hypothetical protein
VHFIFDLDDHFKVDHNEMLYNLALPKVLYYLEKESIRMSFISTSLFTIHYGIEIVFAICTFHFALEK